MAELLCCCLYLFDAIIELHALNENNVQWLSHGKTNMDFTCNKGMINSR